MNLVNLIGKKKILQYNLNHNPPIRVEDTFENVENFISVLSFPMGRNHSEAVVERKWTLESCKDSNPGSTLFYLCDLKHVC